jgi:hypothetical protein
MKGMKVCPSLAFTLFSKAHANFMAKGLADKEVRKTWEDTIQSLCLCTLSKDSVHLPEANPHLWPAGQLSALLLLMKGHGCVNAHVIDVLTYVSPEGVEIQKLVQSCTFALNFESSKKLEDAIARPAEDNVCLCFHSDYLSLLRFQLRQLLGHDALSVLQCTYNQALAEEEGDQLLLAFAGSSEPVSLQLGTLIQLADATWSPPVKNVNEFVAPCVRFFWPLKKLRASHLSHTCLTL